MTFVVRYRTEAQAEIENAFLWFEEQQPGLGLAFIAQLEALEARIAENPLLWQVADEIDVLACFHQHQQPRRREQLLARP